MSITFSSWNPAPGSRKGAWPQLTGTDNFKLDQTAKGHNWTAAALVSLSSWGKILSGDELRKPGLPSKERNVKKMQLSDQLKRSVGSFRFGRRVCWTQDGKSVGTKSQLISWTDKSSFATFNFGIPFASQIRVRCIRHPFRHCPVTATRESAHGSFFPCGLQAVSNTGASKTMFVRSSKGEPFFVTISCKRWMNQPPKAGKHILEIQGVDDFSCMIYYKQRDSGTLEAHGRLGASSTIPSSVWPRRITRELQTLWDSWCFDESQLIG